MKINSQNPSAVKFRLGVNDRYNPESWSTIRTVSDMYIHEDYNWENDIAVFKLNVKTNDYF